MAIVSTAHAKYSGGTGEPNDPYQIATAADLIALGETPEDYDKHFLLTTDIDLDPNLPGRKVFDKAVIGDDWPRFAGVFNGNGHTISHLTIQGVDYLGLFGQLGYGAEVKDLGVVDASITGSAAAGGLVAVNYGTVTHCYSTGAVTGKGSVGGLVGYNSQGSVTACYSTGAVRGGSSVGGLVGYNGGSVTQSYSTGAVSSPSGVGGLVGHNNGSVLNSVWDMETSAQSASAGGVGLTTAEMMDPYMLGLNGFANDPNWVLDAGHDYPRLAWEGAPGQIIPEPRVDWLAGSGTPEAPYRIDTAEQLIFLGRAGALCDRHFVLGADIDLDPKLPGRHVFAQPVIPTLVGVFDGSEHIISHLTMKGGGWLGLFGWLGSRAEVRDLAVVDVNVAGSGSSVGGLVAWNAGLVIRCYSAGAINGGFGVGGLVGENSGTAIDCRSNGKVGGNCGVGGLVGSNGQFASAGGTVARCYSTGAVSGTNSVGGLVGANLGTVTECYSTGSVTSTDGVGGLMGSNYGGTVTKCYSTGAVSGTGWGVGGIVGLHDQGSLIYCYSTSAVSGSSGVGGLVGDIPQDISFETSGSVIRCYSTGAVNGTNSVGGLAGARSGDTVIGCFWDAETSGQTQSEGGTGKTTAEMQDIRTYQGADWDFIGAVDDGVSQIWQMPEGGGYPVLAVFNGYTPPQLMGSGSPDDPYLIFSALELGAVVHYRPDAHYRLAASIDLPGVPCLAVIPRFAGTFDGNGHEISHLTIKGVDYLGLFGQLASGAEVKNLGIVDVNIAGSGRLVGGVAGDNRGTVTECYSTGAVSGTGSGVGGLVGKNSGSVTECYSTCAVNGAWLSGGLVGWNDGRVTQCYGTGAVNSNWGSGGGGLAGRNDGTVTQCYSTGAVSGGWPAGGLVGENYSQVVQCYSTGRVGASCGGLVGTSIANCVTACFWDIQTSGQSWSAGGTGKTTAELQTAKIFLDAGWDFVGETPNGPNDIWKIAEGLDYPRLWWEPYDGRVTVVLGQVFTVTLESNPSTGYRWEWVDHQDSIVEQMGEAQFKPRATGDPPLVGAGGWESFDFKAVHPGQMTLKLVYRRPWEEGVEPLKTFSLQVTVP